MTLLYSYSLSKNRLLLLFATKICKKWLNHNNFTIWCNRNALNSRTSYKTRTCFKIWIRIKTWHKRLLSFCKMIKTLPIYHFKALSNHYVATIRQYTQFGRFIKAVCRILQVLDGFACFFTWFLSWQKHKSRFAGLLKQEEIFSLNVW